MLGNRIDGTHSEFVRVPRADTNLHAIPPEDGEEVLVVLSHLLPSAMACDPLKSGRFGPGHTIAIVGACPLGLATLLLARGRPAAKTIVIDINDHRLAAAKRLGATATINSSNGKAAEAVMQMTAGRGVDTAIEAVGVPSTLALCQQIVAAGGKVARLGAHDAEVDLGSWKTSDPESSEVVHAEAAFRTSGPGTTIASLRHTLLPPITHRFTLDRILEAYETVANAADAEKLQVVIET